MSRHLARRVGAAPSRLVLLLVLLALPVILVFSTAVAQAAHLGLAPGSLGVYTAADACAPGGVTATAPTGSTSASVVVLGSVPSACDGRAVQLVVYRADGAALATAGSTLTVTAGSASVAVPSFVVADAAGVALTLGGWGSVATWVPPVSPTGQWPVTPGNAGTLVSATGYSISNNPVQVCVNITVSTASTVPVAWRVTLDLTKPPFNGQTDAGTYSLQGTDGWRYALYGDTPSSGSMQVGGTQNGGRRSIVSGQQYVVTLCQFHLPNPPVTPSAYTVTTSAPVYDSGTHRACLTTTIAGNGSSEFYVGWTATVDLSGAVALLTANGRAASGWAWPSNDWEVQRTQLPGTSSFVLTSATAGSIAGSQTFVYVACATG